MFICRFWCEKGNQHIDTKGAFFNIPPYVLVVKRKSRFSLRVSRALIAVLHSKIQENILPCSFEWSFFCFALSCGFELLSLIQ